MMVARIVSKYLIPQHVLHGRDQMPHQCTQHKHLDQVPGLDKNDNTFMHGINNINQI